MNLNLKLDGYSYSSSPSYPDISSHFSRNLHFSYEIKDLIQWFLLQISSNWNHFCVYFMDFSSVFFTLKPSEFFSIQKEDFTSIPMLLTIILLTTLMGSLWFVSQMELKWMNLFWYFSLLLSIRFLFFFLINNKESGKSPDPF